MGDGGSFKLAAENIIWLLVAELTTTCTNRLEGF